ncbi:hypothetical protein RRF57_001348 [Xylaria bambusicola]|uniref:Uncharacterized protein n=1 Tax=Xylaria bambusicola TaxID=326684 RepID=A0AAN7UDP6_9PEZI
MPVNLHAFKNDNIANNLLIMDLVHDCSLHHLDLPTDNAPFSTQGAYSADVLQQSVYNIANPNDGALTPEQEILKFGFLSDYLAADTDRMTVGEITDFLDTVLIFIDKYFYRGSLTQGKRRLVILHAWDSSLTLVNGYTLAPLQHLAAPLHIFLRSPSTGKRRPKANLVETCIHESVHAYLVSYFNFCPVNGENVFFFGPDGSGHGILFTVVYWTICGVLRAWHPIMTLDEPVLLDSPNWWPPFYTRMTAKLLRHEWEVTNLEPHEPSNIFRYWRWRPARKIQFKKALLALSYFSFDHYVECRVPSSERAWGFFKRFFMTLVALASLCLLYLLRSKVQYGYILEAVNM